MSRGVAIDTAVLHRVAAVDHGWGKRTTFRSCLSWITPCLPSRSQDRIATDRHYQGTHSIWHWDRRCRRHQQTYQRSPSCAAYRRCSTPSGEVPSKSGMGTP